MYFNLQKSHTALTDCRIGVVPSPVNAHVIFKTWPILPPRRSRVSPTRSVSRHRRRIRRRIRRAIGRLCEPDAGSSVDESREAVEEGLRLLFAASEEFQLSSLEAPQP